MEFQVSQGASVHLDPQDFKDHPDPLVHQDRLDHLERDLLEQDPLVLQLHLEQMVSALGTIVCLLFS